MNVTIWNEFIHENTFDEIKKIYPHGIHKQIGNLLDNDFNITYATLDMPEHGLSESVLKDTDVLIWWGHMAHDKVSDIIVNRVYTAVLSGMGLIVLHSGHGSKIFSKLLGTETGQLKWREAAEKEILWNTKPGHPITEGIGDHFILEEEEMYGEHFNIPNPEDTIFISAFEGGEVFRSGACWTRGLGKIFYFRPGHEAYPTYYDKNVQKVLNNAVKWAKSKKENPVKYGNIQVPIFELKQEENKKTIADLHTKK